MSTIWQTVAGAGEPVDGNPAEFRVIEQRFRLIKDRMFELDGEFDGIRNGTSGDFQGQAADAFRQKLNQIATAVGEVPLIAAQLEGTFRRHREELERLQKRVDAAVARAQSNWNEKCAADSDLGNARHRLSVVDSQIEWLEAQGDAADEGDKYYWTRERIEAQSWVSSSQSRVHRADDALDASKADWRTLHEAENTLDSQTAEALRSTVLWSLADPSFLEQLAEAFADFHEAFASLGEYIFSADFLLDLCELLYNLVDKIAIIASVLSLICVAVAAVLTLTGVGAPIAAFLAGAAVTLKNIAFVMGALKLAFGTILVGANRLELNKLVIDLAIFVGTMVLHKAVHAAKIARLTSLSKVVPISQLERASQHLGALGSTASGLLDAGETAHGAKGFWSFEFSDQYRLGEQSATFGRRSAAGLSHFEFDPPQRLTHLAPFQIRLAPTGW